MQRFEIIVLESFLDDEMTILLITLSVIDNATVR